MFADFWAQLTPSDKVQVVGIIVSAVISVIAIFISVLTLRQNSKMIEESSRPVISIYPELSCAHEPLFPDGKDRYDTGSVTIHRQHGYDGFLSGQSCSFINASISRPINLYRRISRMACA